MLLEKTDARYQTTTMSVVMTLTADLHQGTSSSVLLKAEWQEKGVLKLADFFVHRKVNQVSRIFPQSTEVLKHIYINLRMSLLV